MCEFSRSNPARILETRSGADNRDRWPWRPPFRVFLALALLVLFAEELNWGQRLLGFETPDAVREINYQRQFNLHNLTVIQDRNNEVSMLLVRLLKAYLMLLPLAVAAFPTARRAARWLGVPIPGLFVALATWIVQKLGEVGPSLAYGAGVQADRFRLGEVTEANLQFLLLVVAVEYTLACRARGTGQAAEPGAPGWVAASP